MLTRLGQLTDDLVIPPRADVDALWTNLRDGVESIRFFTDEDIGVVAKFNDTIDRLAGADSGVSFQLVGGTGLEPATPCL